MMKNLSFIKSFLFLGIALIAFNTSFAQPKPTVQQGDYRSTQDGSWGNPATWEQYHNTFGWRNCLTANIAPPARLSYVTIKTGTTVYVDDGSLIPTYLQAMPYGGEGRTVEYPYAANKLIIEAGAKLISTADHDVAGGSINITHPFSGTVTTNTWDDGGYILRVFGNWIQNDGELGGDGADGIILEMPAPFMQGSSIVPTTGFTIAGSGTVTQISKLRMTGGTYPQPPFYAPGPDIPVIIDMNMKITGAGPAFTAVYKPTVTDYYTLRINPGKTVTMTNPLGEIHNQAVANNQASVGAFYTYDIDGTLDCSACTGVMKFTKLATNYSVITVDVTPPGKLIVQHPLEKVTVANSAGDVVFLPATGSGVIVLPLDILSFNAKLNEGIKNEVLLSWSTANERNTREFLVERSNDGKEFSTIGAVNSNNTSGIHNYNFTDAEPFVGTSYYRLKQRDMDGKHKYSAIVSVNARSRTGITTYPNPAKDRLTIVFGERLDGATIEVLSVDGRLLMRTSVTQGNTQQTLDISRLAPGNYMVKLQKGSESSILRFIKN